MVCAWPHRLLPGEALLFPSESSPRCRTAASVGLPITNAGLYRLLTVGRNLPVAAVIKIDESQSSQRIVAEAHAYVV